MATQTASQTTQAKAPQRIRSTVFHKSDHRIRNIENMHPKRDIIKLYNIEAMMLFRVEQAHVQFDPENNNRPYIYFQGYAEGVYLPASTGLLFPNMCDQLDFRPDFRVSAALEYALSDIEIATLANNGLFNYDWSCQGRVIGALLEIPAMVDYYAIASTPITYVEIQKRLALPTSTRKTGYKTMVASFLPYAAQKHNLEKQPKMAVAGEYDANRSEIRKRGQYDTKDIGFVSEAGVVRKGASFVENAQARIEQRLREQMQKGNVLEIEAAQTSQQIADTIEVIKSQTEKAKRLAAAEAGERLDRPNAATVDARLNDMKNRMAYEGAQAVPLETPKIEAESLAIAKKPGTNSVEMTSAVAKPNITPDKIHDINKSQAGEPADKLDNNDIKPEAAAKTIDAKSDDIHAKAIDSDKTAGNIAATAKSRREALAARRLRLDTQAKQQRDAVQRIIAAGEDEAKKGLIDREEDIKNMDAMAAKESKASGKPAPGSALDDDILSGNTDIDDIINAVEGRG